MIRFSLACLVAISLLIGCNATPPVSNSAPTSATHPSSASTTRPTTRPASSTVYYLVEGVLVRADAQGKGHKELTTQDMKILSFRVTPDGSKVVCLREPRNVPTIEGKNTARREITILDRDGNLVRTVKNSGAEKDWPINGPPTILLEGKRVGFIAVDPDTDNGFAGPPVYCIITMDMDGRNSRRVAAVSMNGVGQKEEVYGTNVNATAGGNWSSDAVAWSPDGRTILCTLYRSNPKTRRALDRYWMWAMDADGTHVRQVGPDGSALGSFSPAGKRIAYVNIGARATEIMVANADGTHPRQVTHLDAILSSPRWLSDGTTIVFLKVHAEGAPVGTVYAIQSDGTRLRQISRDNEPAVIDASNDAGLQNLAGRL